jgi:hypothetical protein
MYQTKISAKLTAYSSLNYAVQSTLKSQNTRNISTGIYVDLTPVIDVGENSKTLLSFPSKKYIM